MLYLLAMNKAIILKLIVFPPKIDILIKSYLFKQLN